MKFQNFLTSFNLVVRFFGFRIAFGHYVVELNISTFFSFLLEIVMSTKLPKDFTSVKVEQTVQRQQKHLCIWI